MIQVENQYILMLGIGPLHDFLDSRDLISFLVTEAAGGELPAFQVTFKIRDPEVRKRINQKEIVNISIGRDYKEVQPVGMMIYSSGVIPDGQSQWIVSLTGTLNVPKFLTDAKIKEHVGTGTGTLAKVASTTFKIDDTSTPSEDSQTWIQYGISDRKFLKEVWQHTNIPKSFPLVAISLDGTFILKDITTVTSSKARYDLTKDVVLSTAAEEITKFGLINNWTGFKRSGVESNIESGTDRTLTEIVTSHIVLSGDLEQHLDPGINTLPFCVTNDNVHPEYQASSIRNVSGLAIYSGAAIQVSFPDFFLPIRPLDLVYYKEAVGKDALSVEAVSGNYIVSRIGRGIQNSKFSTTLELVREGRNTS